MNIIHSKEIKGQDFSARFLSHELYVGPKRIIECKFEEAYLNGARLEGIHFIKCDFTSTDLSNSEIIDCIFEDCILDNAGIFGSSISGTVFVYSEIGERSPFFNTSFANSIFSSSQSGPCKFIKVALDNVSFRGLIFNSVVFESCKYGCIPKESAAFVDCTFDYLDLRQGSLKGLKLIDCLIKRLDVNFESVFSIIGIYQTLKNSEFAIHCTGESGKYSIEALDELTITTATGLESLAANGSLFEYLNGISILSHYLNDVISEDFYETNKQALMNINQGVVGDIRQDIQMAFTKFIEQGSTKTIINLNSINFALNIFLYEQFYTLQLQNQIHQLVHLAKSKRFSFTAMSEVQFKLESLSKLKDGDNYCITFRYHIDTDISYAKAAQLSESITVLLNECGLNSYKPIYRGEGSIVEKLVTSKKSLISSYPKLIGIIALIGFNFTAEFKDNQFNVSIKYELPLPQLPVSKEKKKEVIDKSFEKVKVHSEESKAFESLSLEEVKLLLTQIEKSRLMQTEFVKRPELIQMHIQEAEIGHLNEAKAENSFLIQKSSSLELLSM